MTIEEFDELVAAADLERIRKNRLNLGGDVLAAALEDANLTYTPRRLADGLG